MQSNTLLNHLYKYLRRRKVLLIYFPLTIYWNIIFIATSIPIDGIPHIFKFQDKFEHFVAYFILAILISFTLHFQDKNIKLKQRFFYFSLLILILYGALDELHQMLIPGRIADFYDWLADIIGGTLGILLSSFIIAINLKNSMIISTDE